MASFLKGFVRPRLQLLVLMLILGTGLLPENSMVEDECLKKPAEPTAKKVDCPTGFCYHQIVNVGVGELLERGCGGSPIQFSDVDEECLKKEPEMCYKFEFTGDFFGFLDADPQTAYGKCRTAKKPKTGRAAADGKSGNKAAAGLYKEACLCNTDLCNDKAFERRKLTPAPAPSPPETGTTAGVKHLGCNVALVGALLVVVFPLQTMSLVG